MMDNAKGPTEVGLSPLPEGSRYQEVWLTFERKTARPLSVRIGSVEVRALKKNGTNIRLGVVAPREVQIRRTMTPGGSLEGAAATEESKGGGDNA